MRHILSQSLTVTPNDIDQSILLKFQLLGNLKDLKHSLVKAQNPLSSEVDSAYNSKLFQPICKTLSASVTSVFLPRRCLSDN